MWFYKIERDEKNKYINITWNTTMTYIKSILGVVGVGACLFNLGMACSNMLNDFSCGTDILFISIWKSSSNTS